MNAAKLFVMTCFLTCLLRFLSFSEMACLNYGESDGSLQQMLRASSASGASSREVINNSAAVQVFFDKVTLVLFNFPDFCCISAYVLLLVVWAEAILETRRHWLSSISFRQLWLKLYVSFNISLYLTQVCLYLLLFVPSVNQDILVNSIYITLTTINLVIPVVWICAFVYLTLLFAGFPFNSNYSRRRLGQLSLQGNVWTISRLLWGSLCWASVSNRWLLNSTTSVEYFFVMFGIFFVCEMLPMLVSLSPSFLTALVRKTSLLNDSVGNFDFAVNNSYEGSFEEYENYYDDSSLELAPKGLQQMQGSGKLADLSARFEDESMVSTSYQSSDGVESLQSRSTGTSSEMSYDDKAQWSFFSWLTS